MITTTTAKTDAAPPQPDDRNVTVMLPGGAVVICKPDQVHEITRLALFSPRTIGIAPTDLYLPPVIC